MDGYLWKQLIEGVKHYLTKVYYSGYHNDVVSFVIYEGRVQTEVRQKPVKEALEKINSILKFHGGMTEFGIAISKSMEILLETPDKYDMKFLFLSDGDSNTGNPEIERLGRELRPKVWKKPPKHNSIPNSLLNNLKINNKGLKFFIVTYGNTRHTDKLKTMAALHGHDAQFLYANLTASFKRNGGSNNQSSSSFIDVINTVFHNLQTHKGEGKKNNLQVYG